MKQFYRYSLFLFCMLFCYACGTDSIESEEIPPVEVPPYVPGGEIGVLKDIKVPVASATVFKVDEKTGKEVPISGDAGHGMNLSFDGNFETYFSATWIAPALLDYKFENVPAIDYLVYYHPKELTGYIKGCFGQGEIWVATVENPELVKWCSFDLEQKGITAKLSLGKTVVNPTTIRVKVINSGNASPTCSEMEFFKDGGLDFDPLTIFTDATCSVLKPNITEKEVNAISSDFFKNIALSMLQKSYPTEYRIQEYKSYPHPSILAKQYKIDPYSLRDNPTGISVSEGDDLVVMAGDLHDQKVSVLIQDLEVGWGGSSYSLKNGINVLKAQNKGLIYVMYYTEDGSEQPPVKIHIASGKVNGVFNTAKHKKEDWMNLLWSAVDKHIDVVGKHAQLTFPVADLKKYCTDGYRLMEIYDSIVSLEHAFMGIEIPNHMYCHVSYKSSDWMYATAYRTVYQTATLSDICDIRQMHSNAAWGPAHEIGHVNQTRPGLKWHGMTEVTNNIQSLYVQTTFNYPSSLEAKRAGFPHNSVYELAFDRIIVEKNGHNELTKGVANSEESTVGNEVFFIKLVPFWQLQLYESNVRGKKDFYKKVYEAVRQAPNPATDGKSQLAFVKHACIAAEEDLTEFFTAWGFFKPMKKKIDDYGEKEVEILQTDIDQTLKEIAALGYPKPKMKFQYITDKTADLFKSGGSVVKGTMLQTGYTITMTNWKNVVAFEAYDGDKLVFVSAASKFLLNGIYDHLKIYGVAADGTKVEATE